LIKKVKFVYPEASENVSNSPFFISIMQEIVKRQREWVTRNS